MLAERDAEPVLNPLIGFAEAGRAPPPGDVACLVDLLLLAAALACDNVVRLLFVLLRSTNERLLILYSTFVPTVFCFW